MVSWNVSHVRAHRGAIVVLVRPSKLRATALELVLRRSLTAV